MGLFSRLAQATYLVSQALRSVSPAADSRDTMNGDDDQTAQLRRTLLALVHKADGEGAIRRLEFCPQSALCYR